MASNNTHVFKKVNTRVVCFFNTNVLSYNPMKYGERLRLAREHKKMTQNDLVKSSGVKQGTISKIERGDQDASSFDVDLAYALDIDPMWLKTGEKKFEPQWIGGSIDTVEKISKTLFKTIEQLSIEQQKQIEQFVLFIASQTPEKTQQNENNPLTSPAQNAGGGG